VAGEKRQRGREREKERKGFGTESFFFLVVFLLLWFGFYCARKSFFVVVEGGVCRSLGFGRWKERKKES
jgi:hypothetical protein